MKGEVSLLQSQEALTVMESNRLMMLKNFLTKSGEAQVKEQVKEESQVQHHYPDLEQLFEPETDCYRHTEKLISIAPPEPRAETTAAYDWGTAAAAEQALQDRKDGTFHQLRHGGPGENPKLQAQRVAVNFLSLMDRKTKGEEYPPEAEKLVEALSELGEHLSTEAQNDMARAVHSMPAEERELQILKHTYTLLQMSNELRDQMKMAPGPIQLSTVENTQMLEEDDINDILDLQTFQLEKEASAIQVADSQQAEKWPKKEEKALYQEIERLLDQHQQSVNSEKKPPDYYNILRGQVQFDYN